MFPYIECPLSDLPSEESLLDLLSAENSLPNKEKRSQFLCHIRLMCLNFFKNDISGIPSTLLEKVKEFIEQTSDKDILLPVYFNILLTLRNLEYEQEVFFEKPTALFEMRDCYSSLKELFQKINDTISQETEVYFEDGSQIYNFKLGGITSDLFSKDSSSFFRAFVFMLDGICKSLSKQTYFKKNMWKNREDHLDENAVTRCFCSYLESIVSTLNLKITVKQEYYIGKDRCDIIITTPNKEVIPIEAKNSKNSELWKAIEGQLITKYMQDDNHYGVYLVYWLGINKLTNPPRKLCSLPSSHTDLQSNLEEHCIPESHKDRVKVFCLNCD